MGEDFPTEAEERRIAEQDAQWARATALQERCSMLEAVIEVFSDAVYLKDTQGRYMLINAAGARMIGKTVEEVIGLKDADLFPPEIADPVIEIDREMLTGGTPRTFERVTTLLGITRTFEVTKGPYQDTQGRMIGTIGVARDISKRKKAEEVFRETEEFLSRLLDHTPAQIYVITEDGRIRLVNRAWEETFGKRREEIIGRPVVEIFPPEMARVFLDQNQRVLKTAGPIGFEESVNTLEGPRSLYTVKFPLRNADDQIEAVGGISFDINDRKQAEESLEKSRRRLQALFDNTLDGIWLMDDEGRIVDANPAICSLLGYSRDEFLQMKIEDVTAGIDGKLARDLWNTILTQGQLSGEFTLISKDGTPREIDYRAVGQILPGLNLFVNRDITGRKRTEQELRTLNAALEHAVEGISQLDREGCYLMVNRAYADMHGYQPEEMIGQEWLITVHPRDLEKSRADYQRMLEEGRSENEVLGVRKDGSTFWKGKVRVRSDDPQGQWIGHFCFAKDISERKRADEALRQYADQLHVLSRRVIEVQEEERRHLARELHDEIGQTLTAIGINLQAVKRLTGAEMVSPLDECIGIVDQSIRQVRNLSLDLRPSMLDDLGIVATLRWYLDRQAQRVGFRALFIADPEDITLDPSIAIAAFRVAQEALTNVARHAQAKRVRLSLRRRDGILRLIIRDDGVGFDPEEARRRGRRGESLGLLGMRDRAALLGGKVRIRSAPGQGTVVQLTIHRKEIPEDTFHPPESS